MDGLGKRTKKKGTNEPRDKGTKGQRGTKGQKGNVHIVLCKVYIVMFKCKVYSVKCIVFRI